VTGADPADGRARRAVAEAVALGASVETYQPQDKRPGALPPDRRPFCLRRRTADRATAHRHTARVSTIKPEACRNARLAAEAGAGHRCTDQSAEPNAAEQDVCGCRLRAGSHMSRSSVDVPIMCQKSMSLLRWSRLPASSGTV
jgi:hypothetical protein